MGFSFKKSFNLGPFRLNLSKSGIGYSIGTKGLRFTKKANGGYRTTASIPGTGISWRKDIPNSSKQKVKDKEDSELYTIGAQFSKKSIQKMHERTFLQYANIINDKIKLVQAHPDKFSPEDIERLKSTANILQEEIKRRYSK